MITFCAHMIDLTQDLRFFLGVGWGGIYLSTMKKYKKGNSKTCKTLRRECRRKPDRLCKTNINAFNDSLEDADSSTAACQPAALLAFSATPCSYLRKGSVKELQTRPDSEGSKRL